jgi:hypothetical protein
MTADADAVLVVEMETKTASRTLRLAARL